MAGARKVRLRQIFYVAALTAVIAAGLSAPSSAAEELANLTPAAPQPQSGALKPGLAVTYYFHIFNSIGEIPEYAKVNAGDAGSPIAVLDYKVGSGRVLTSDRDDGVGADITGLIHFAEVGTYHLAMQSNDGVRLKIGGQVVVDDPGVHADRFSEIVPIRIERPGWYPLSLLYFEKRNTATLRLYWLPPDQEGGLRTVPAESLAHVGP